MYPAWSFWSGGPAIKLHPSGLGRWDLLKKSILKEAEKWQWNDKIPKGFFRGSRTSDQRDALVLLSRSSPELVDAAFTKNQAWKSDKVKKNLIFKYYKFKILKCIRIRFMLHQPMKYL